MRRSKCFSQSPAERSGDFPGGSRKFRSAFNPTCSDISLITAEVIHQSGAPSTALRLSDGEKVFAYSGDTEWTDALLPIAADADLFICECYADAGKMTGHMSWEILKSRLPDLRARRIMVTHMNPSVLARLDEIKAAGVLAAEDGLQFEF